MRRHLVRRDLDDGGKGEQELAIRQRMVGAVAQHDGRQQVRAAVELHEPRTLPEFAR